MKSLLMSQLRFFAALFTVCFSNTVFAQVITLSFSPSPPNLTFTGTAVGTQTAAQNVTINNTSILSTLTVNCALSGIGFAASNNLGPRTVNPGAQLVIPIRFTPPILGGSRTGVMSCSTNSQITPTIVFSLTGNNPPIIVNYGVAPTSLSFTGVTIGSAVQRDFEVTETASSNIDLTIENCALSGPNAADFSFTAFNPQFVQPNTRGAITVRFTPRSFSAAASGATLTCQTPRATAPNASSFSVALTGTNPIPAVIYAHAAAVRITALAFGRDVARLLLGTNSSASQASLSIVSCAVSGPNAAAFALRPLSSLVAPGAPIQAELTFISTARDSTTIRANATCQTPNATSPSSTSFTLEVIGINPPPIVNYTLSSTTLTFTATSLTATPPQSVALTRSAGSDAQALASSCVFTGPNARAFVIPAPVGGGVFIVFTPTAVDGATLTATMTCEVPNATAPSPRSFSVQLTGINPGVPACNLSDSGIDCDDDGILNGFEAANGLNPAIKDNDVFTNNRLFVQQQYRDFLGREADEGGLLFWASALVAGTQTRESMIEAFTTSGEFDAQTAPMARLYFGTYLRIPDIEGLNFWTNEFRTGKRSLLAIGEAFATAPEFVARYGSVGNREFVALLYTNILGRAVDVDGSNFWTAELDSGRLTRGGMLTQFTESAEYRGTRSGEIFTTLLYAGTVRRAPVQTEFDDMVSQIQQGVTLQSRVQLLIRSAEYRSRFLP